MTKTLLLAVLLLTGFAAGGQEHRVEEVAFSSHGDRLSGSIVLPGDGPVHAAVVFVHGSGEQVRDLRWARRFADDGVAALVYDKRGVGRSGGTYEGRQSVSGPNIALLADDAAAALDVLARHPQLRGVPRGLAGISQAGWIIPPAAEKSGAVDFMVVWSGPVCKVSEEDIYSKYTGDRDGPRVPAYAQALAARTEPYVWPGFLGTDSDPAEPLARLRIPGLWIFGGEDGSIPVDLSLRNLQALRAAGHRYDTVLFSHLGHNNMPETFATATDWIRRTAKQESPGQGAMARGDGRAIPRAR